jgi:hypothetical protein
MTATQIQGKRAQGAPATVKIEAPREKGGFMVQEEGRSKGVLLLGPAPEQLPEVGALINVFIQDDDAMNPQYRWDSPVKRPKPQAKRGFGNRPKR